MSAILAIFNRTGEPVCGAVVSAMLAAAPHRAVDGQAAWQQDAVALAYQHFSPLSPVTTACPLPGGTSDLMITADVRLDNRADLIAQLQPVPENSAAGAACVTDAGLILLAYQKWGVDCPRYLLGDFAFVLWDGRRQHLFAARDPLGVRDLCYYVDNQRALLASEIQQLLAHPDVTVRLNEAKVAQYLTMLWQDQAETFYAGIFYCPPAHSLYISATVVQCQRYWDVDPHYRIRYRQPEAYAAHFRDLFTQAVACRLPAQGTVGISLSGGLDSASVAAAAAQQTVARLHSFSYVFDELPDCDERAYIAAVVTQYDLKATTINGDDKWPLRDRATWPVLRDFVYADPFVRLPLAVMSAAQQAGCRLLLTGHYGDILFAGRRYWLADMVRDGRWGELALLCAHHQADMSWRQDVWEYGLRSFLPWPVRRLYRRWRPRSLAAQHPALHPDLVRRTNLEARGSQAVGEAAFCAPGQWPRYRHLTLSVVPQGIAAARQLYNQHGLEAVDPFLDRRLVEFALAAPADQLGRPHRSKWVLREAMREDLPVCVRERKDKTRLLTLLEKGLREREQAAVRAILVQSEIVRREFVRDSWLQQALTFGPDWPQNRAFLWLCLSLELWLQRYWVNAPG